MLLTAAGVVVVVVVDTSGTGRHVGRPYEVTIDMAHCPASTAHEGPNHPAEDQPGTMVDVITLTTGAEVVGATGAAVVDSQSLQLRASVLATG